MKMNSITNALGKHYTEKFALYGPSSEGVDWGTDASKLFLRYEKMLAVIQINSSQSKTLSLLDVGCGFGGLLSYAKDYKSYDFDLEYTGIDVAENMIRWAKDNIDAAEFICGDVMQYAFDRKFDYVICNGILTQKLDTPGLEMDQFASQLIRCMFNICNVGIVFNVMTTKVNYYANNLYYRNPAELLAWCLSEISPHLRLDHSYPLYEYTMYLYRQPN